MNRSKTMKPFSSLSTGLVIGLAIGLVIGTTGELSANGTTLEKDKVSVMASKGSSSNANNPARYWYDSNGEKRYAMLDNTQVVQFEANGKTSILPALTAQTNEKSVLARSPLFIENGQRRALPGGILIELRQAKDEKDAKAQLTKAGLTPVRMISSDGSAKLWLVASPPGIETLDMANRLAESNQFQSARPNWWTERKLK